MAHDQGRYDEVIRLLGEKELLSGAEEAYLAGVAWCRLGMAERALGALKGAIARGGTLRVSVAGKPIPIRALAAYEAAFLLAEQGAGDEVARLAEALRDQRITRVPVLDGSGTVRGENRLGVLLRFAELLARKRSGDEAAGRILRDALDFEKGLVPWEGRVSPLPKVLAAMGDEF